MNALRRAGRIAVAAAAAWFFIVVATQYVRVLQRNMELAQELSGRRAEIAIGFDEIGRRGLQPRDDVGGKFAADRVAAENA